MIILGWRLEVPPFKETPIYHLPKFTISEISVSASSVISRSLRSSMMTTMIHKRCTARFVLVRTRPSSDNACLPFTHHNYLGKSPIEMNWNELKWIEKVGKETTTKNIKCFVLPFICSANIAINQPSELHTLWPRSSLPSGSCCHTALIT